MPALSKSAILSRLRKKELIISPILSVSQLGASSIDLRMGTVVLVSRARAQSHVDPSAYSRESDNPADHDSIRSKKQKHERFDVPFKESFLLHPGALALVATLEWLRLPYNIQGVVTARSSWAREGLNIATATIINPGYRGIVTLELANFGEIPIKLYPGLRLAQIAFYELKCSDPASDMDVIQSQFDNSFEPSGGNIAARDDPFVPKESTRPHSF